MRRGIPVTLLVAVAVVVGLRLYRLDGLQSELYGDITIVREYVDWIRAGQWPTYFITSAGPLYHYLIVPILAVAGADYLGIKIASVLTSLAVLLVTYLLARRLGGPRVALVALFLAGVSSWLLIFSRLGNSQVLAPLLVLLPLYFLARYLDSHRRADLVACAATAPLGLYCLPQTFFHAPILLALLLVLWISRRGITGRDVATFLVVAAIVSLPFPWIVWQDRSNFFEGYIGGKLESSAPFTVALGNAKRALLGFHLRGDVVMRSNPPGAPHLDVVTGALMLLGLGFALRRDDRRWLILVVLPLLLLLVPSVLVLHTPHEIPSASRTIATAPLACLLAALGLERTAALLGRRFERPWLAAAAVGGCLLAALALNVDRYFRRYLAALPYDNTPIARLVADYVDRLPLGTTAYLIGCCWEGGMPEPKSIEYELAGLRRFVHWEHPRRLDCAALDAMDRPAVLIWSFHTTEPSPSTAPCIARLPAQVYASERGLPVFIAAPLLEQGGEALTTEARPTPPPLVRGEGEGTVVVDELVQGRGVVGGHAVEITHSRLDIGAIEALFDGDRESLIRGAGDNPFVLALEFAQGPVELRSIRLELGHMPDFAITTLAERAGAEPQRKSEAFVGLPGEPVLDLVLPGDPAQPVERVRIEVFDRTAIPDYGYHVHVRGLSIDPPGPTGASSGSGSE